MDRPFAEDAEKSGGGSLLHGARIARTDISLGRKGMRKRRRLGVRSFPGTRQARWVAATRSVSRKRLQPTLSLLGATHSLLRSLRDVLFNETLDKSPRRA